MSHATDLAAQVDKANRAIRDAAALLPWDDPVGCVQWIHVDRLQANDYNPNAVAHSEMRLLYVSIASDGYTQPIVAIRDKTNYVIVDGFHRYTIMRKYPDIYDRTSGHLPVVVLDKPPADRMASTIRHNRARGKHSIAGMGSLVFSMLMSGEDDASICNKIGLEAEELARLKHVTGFSKLFADVAHSPHVLTAVQMQERADYAAAHPDEKVHEF